MKLPPPAELIRFGEEEEPGSYKSDQFDAARVASLVYGEDVSLEVLEKAWAPTKKLVIRFWPHIERLAKALYDAGQIDADEANAMLDDVPLADYDCWRLT